MPTRPPAPCPECGVLVLGGGRCSRHRRAARQAVDERRGTAAQRGYDARWRRYREGYLRQHPLCRICEQDGRVVPATDVDHIIPYRGDQALFWDPGNHQPLCHACHSSKTAREDGGFGHGTG